MHEWRLSKSKECVRKTKKCLTGRDRIPKAAWGQAELLIFSFAKLTESGRNGWAGTWLPSLIAELMLALSGSVWAAG